MSKFIASACLLTCLLASAAPLPASANDSLIEMSKNPADWVMPLGNYAGHRYSALDQITSKNAHELQVAWMFSTGALRGHAGSPLKIGDTLFFVTPFPNKVFSLDLKNDGKVLWKYTTRQDPQLIDKMCCDTVNRGLVYSDGILYLHQPDTSVLALDAKTGREIWKTKNGDWKRGETGTAAPLVVGDNVLVGISSDQFGVRCHLTAYHKITGKRVWRAYTAGTDKEILFDPNQTTVLGKPVGRKSSLKTWNADDIKHSGGCAWGWITYDPDLNLIYYGTGAPAPASPVQRPGDNRWTSSIIARDADTGMARWVYQTTPHDEWSYGATGESILVEKIIDGLTRKVLVQFNQNGLAYMLDRATGELLAADKFELSTNWTTGIDLTPASPTFGRPNLKSKYSLESNGQDINTEGVCPDSKTGGAKGQQPAAWHPGRKLFVVPTSHLCMDIEPFKVSFTPGVPYEGTTIAQFPAPNDHGGMGNTLAWNLEKKLIEWNVPRQFQAYSGALVTKGDIAFYGTLDGHFIATRLSDGKELFNFRVGSGIIGNPISFEHRGKQFIAVLTGLGGKAAVSYVDPKNPFYQFRGSYAGLNDYVSTGGNLVVFALPDKSPAP